jgi:Flp pilus assembly pilin Flp
MKKILVRLLVDDRGQDLIEYALLMAFIALASAVLFVGAGGNISGIWTSSDPQLTASVVSSSM